MPTPAFEGGAPLFPGQAGGTTTPAFKGGVPLFPAVANAAAATESPTTERWEITKGVLAGLRNAAAMYASAGGTVADAVGAGGMEGVLDTFADEFRQEAAKYQGKNQTVRSIMESDDKFDAAVNWALYNIGQGAATSIPVLVATLATGGVGGMVAAGAMGAGDVRLEEREAGVDPHAGRELALAVPYALVEKIGAPFRISKALKGGGGAKSFARRLPGEVAKTTLGEAASEGSQAAITETGVALGKDESILERLGRPETLERIGEEAAAGAVFGGPGGVIAAIPRGQEKQAADKQKKPVSAPKAAPGGDQAPPPPPGPPPSPGAEFAPVVDVEPTGGYGATDIRTPEDFELERMGEYPIPSSVPAPEPEPFAVAEGEGFDPSGLYRSQLERGQQPPALPKPDVLYTPPPGPGPLALPKPGSRVSVEIDGKPRGEATVTGYTEGKRPRVKLDGISGIPAPYLDRVKFAPAENQLSPVMEATARSGYSSGGMLPEGPTTETLPPRTLTPQQVTPSPKPSTPSVADAAVTTANGPPLSREDAQRVLGPIGEELDRRFLAVRPKLKQYEAAMIADKVRQAVIDTWQRGGSETDILAAAENAFPTGLSYLKSFSPNPISPPAADSTTAETAPAAERASRAAPPKPIKQGFQGFDDDDFLTFLRRAGGLKMDLGGELRARDLHKPTKGLGILIRKNGMDLDYAREAAEEAGFLPVGATVNDFLKLLDRAVGDKAVTGKNTYGVQGTDRQLDEAHALAADIARQRYEDQFESEGERLSIEEYNALDKSAAEAYLAYERAAVEHLEPDEIHVVDGEPITLADLEKIDAAIAEAEAVTGQRQGRDEQSEVAGERAGAGENSLRETGRGNSGQDQQTERTDQGEQVLIPGVRPVTDRDRIEAQATKPLRSKATQKPADEGLFDVGGRGQMDLVEQARKAGEVSQYLVQGVEPDRYKTPPYRGNPYPVGMERAAINAAFDKLFDTMDVREGNRGPALYSRYGTAAPPFFSALTRAVDGLKQPKAPAKQWAGMIQNLTSKGVKQEEIDWSGVVDWLGEQTGPVTKDELLGFLRANEVKVQEVEKGGDESAALDRQGEAEDAVRAAADKLSREYGPKVSFEGEEVYWDELFPRLSLGDIQPSDFAPHMRASVQAFVDAERAVQDAREVARDAGDNADTKFASYTLPGGENYRELLLTLPSPRFEDGYVSLDAEGFIDQYWPTKEDAKKRANEIGGKWSDAPLKEKMGETEFTGSHWDEPNVIAHVRFNERTDSDGNRVLFIEEIQSDWHQMGRKRGYKTGGRLIDGHDRYWWRREAQRLFELISSLPRGAERNEVEDALSVAVRNRQTLSEGDPSAVPDAPFKRTWPELAFKRMVRYAAENGFDKVAWTTGEHQADRYDLSKQIDSIGYQKRGELFNIAIWDKSGEEVYRNQSVDSQRLEDTVGKEMAQKIANGEGRKEKDFTYLEGLDLKVGGEGMRGFYDKMLPAFAAKFGKKFGAKVDEVTLPGAASQDQITEFTNKNDYTPDDMELSGKAWSLTIPPQMREAALKGLPLFDRYGAPKIPAAEQAKIADRVKTIVKQMAPGANVEIVDRLFSATGAEVSGRYSAARQLISVALNYADPETTARHEVIHFLREAGLFTDAEWSMLETAARRDWAKKYDVEGAYPDLDRDAQHEEAVAQAFAEWKSGRGKHAPRFRRLFARIRDFFQRVANALRGMGYRTVGDVFETVESGEVGGRPGAARGAQGDKDSVFGLRREAAPMYADPEPSTGHDAERAIIGRIMGTTDKPLKQRVRENIEAVKTRRGLAFKQAVLDQFAAIEALAQENEAKALEHWNNAKAPYLASRMTQNLQSVMAVVLRHGPIEVYDDPNGGKWFRAKTGWTDGGFEDIFTPLAEKGVLDLWKGWAMAVRANRLKGEGRENLMTDQEIDTLLRLEDEFPEFREVHDKWQRFNRAMLDMAEASGLINAEQRATWERDDYVPFYRIMDDDVKAAGKGKGGLEGQRSGIRTLKGGESAVNDIVENMVLNMTSLVDRSFKNMAMQKVSALALDANVMETVRWKWFDKATVSAVEMADKLMDIGVDVRGMDQSQVSQVFDFWHMRQPTDPDIVSVMVDGKPKFYRVNDPMLLRAISSLGPRPLGDIMKLFSMAKRTLTQGVTADPAFMAANVIRDTLSAWVVTGQKGFVPGKDSIKGAIKAMRANDPSKVAIMAAGGGTGGFYRTAPSDVRKQMDAKLRGVDKNTILDTPKKAWEFWRKVGQASESANRIAIRDAVKANGGSDMEAAFQAMDLLDFAMRGDHAAMRHLTEMVPFLNARIQGLYRLQRGFQENQRTFLLRGAIIAAATMALWSINEDDERYKELPDWDRDTYWHFWIGDQHFRLPKPFEVGVLFGTIPERIAANLAGHDKWKHTGDAAKRAFLDTFAMNPTPQLFKPIIEQYANRNFFFDSPIVGRDLEALPSGMQAKPWTSETLQAIGEATGASPVRVEALIRGYFGTIGTYLLAAADALVTRPLTDAPPEPAMRVDDIPVLKRFMRDDPARTTRYVNEFYDMRDEIAETVSAVRELRRRGELEAAAELMRDKGDKVRLRKGFEATARKLSDISKRMRVIERHREMSPEDKRRELDQLTKLRNDFARRMVEAAPATNRIVSGLSGNAAAINRLEQAVQ